MDTKLDESGAHLVEVYLENSFAHGDGLWARYVSATLAKFEDCKAEAALGLVVLLLANRPNGVHLHGSTLANITRVRECAMRLHQAALGAPGVPAGTPDVSGAMARDRPEPRPRGHIASPQQITPAAEQELRELFGQFPVDVELTPHRLRQAVWMRFAELLPQGQLKPFCGQCPEWSMCLKGHGRNGDVG